MSATKPTAATTSALKVLDVLEALSGYAVNGVSNKALAELCRTDAAAITRAVSTLIEKGWARKEEATGHFHPTAQFTRLAFTVLADFQKAEQRLADGKTHFTQGN